MRAVLFRVVRRLRHAPVATAVSTLLVAVAVATVVALGAGAHRTATAPDRYTTAYPLDSDTMVTQAYGPPLTDAIADLPGVDAASSVTFVFGAISRDESLDGAFDSFVFVGDPTSQGLRVVEGRPAEAAGEIVVTDTFAAVTGVHVGDGLELLTYSQTVGESGSFGVDPPDRPVESVSVVGVAGGRSVGDPSKALDSIAFLSPATVDGTDIGIVTSLISVDLADGTDREVFQASLGELAGRPGADALTVEPLSVVAETVRTAVRMQAVSLWVMTAVAAAAAVAALGQLITRGARLAPDDELTLRSIGYGRSQLVGESLASAVAVIAVGAVLGMAAAPFASSIFPTGFVARIEPDRGLRFDAPVVLLGGFGMALGFTAWAAVSLVFVRSRARAATPPAIATRLASVSVGPAVATGTRLAFARTGREAGSVRATVVGLVFAVAAVTGAVTVGVSVHRLVSDPARFGANYDAYFGNGGLPEVLPEQLLADPDIGGVTLVSEAQVDAGDTTLRVLGLDLRRGEVLPLVLDGRAPRSDDEIALGSVDARSLDVGVGDVIELRGPAGDCTCRVTGLVVVPSVGVNAGVGRDGVLTGDGFRRLVGDVAPSVALTSVNGGPDALRRLVEQYAATTPGEQVAPDVIGNLSLASGVPNALAILLGCLAAIGVVHAALQSVRRRRRDVAVLAVLGAERGWLRTMSHVQVTAGLVVPVVAGVPIGFVVGTLVFRAIAGSIGAVDTSSLPIVTSLVLGVAVFSLANVAALPPARRVRRTRPAAVLTTE